MIEKILLRLGTFLVNSETNSVQIPAAFNQMKGDEEKSLSFEIKDLALMPCTLFSRSSVYSPNLKNSFQKKFGVIFANSFGDIEYFKKYKQMAYSLLRDELEIKEEDIDSDNDDLTRDEVHTKFEELREKTESSTEQVNV